MDASEPASKGAAIRTLDRWLVRYIGPQTYVREGQVKAANQTLDFFLPEHGVYIEVKQFHSPRIADQMTRAPNIIVAQGRPAVELLAEMIRCWGNAR